MQSEIALDNLRFILNKKHLPISINYSNQEFLFGTFLRAEYKVFSSIVIFHTLGMKRRSSKD